MSTSRSTSGMAPLGWGRLAAIILGGWWRRVRGHLEPSACPFSIAKVLDAPGRSLVAPPASVLARFAFRTGDRVLEIGPGTGFYSVEAAKRVGHSGRLILVDVQLDMLLEARRRVETAGQTAYPVLADARALPFATGSLDHVFAIGVLGEIPERSTALAEVKRVLHVSGRLSVSEQLPDPDFIGRRVLRRELDAAGFDEDMTRGRFFYTSTWSTGKKSRALPSATGSGRDRWAGVS